MSNFIKELRANSETLGGIGMLDSANLMDEAADEIERLSCEGSLKDALILKIRVAIAHTECTCEVAYGPKCPRCNLIERVEILVSTHKDSVSEVQCSDCGERVTDLQAHCEREDNICLIHGPVSEELPPRMTCECGAISQKGCVCASEGEASDLYGEAMTPADVNDENFGVSEGRADK